MTRRTYPSITFRVNHELLNRLTQEADEHDETLSATIKRLLTDAMDYLADD